MDLCIFFWNLRWYLQRLQDENFKSVSQQYRAWSDCTDVQTGLTLYWWQTIITFGSSRVKVKHDLLLQMVMTVIMQSFEEIFYLIELMGFGFSVVLCCVFAGQIYLRYKEPNLHRPIKVIYRFFLNIFKLFLCKFFTIWNY